MQTWLMGTQKDPTMLGQAANAWKQIPNMISNSAVGDTYRSASGAISAAFGGGVFGGSGGGNNEAFGSTVTHPGKGTGGSVNDIPMPTGDGNWAALQNTILAAAKMAGVSPDLMATMANIESGFRASVKAGTSSATGLYQFINSTWEEMIRKHAGKYGISPQASRSDPRANALMGAEFLKENITFLKRQLGRDPTDTEMYLAHFMGAGGAGKLLSMLKSNPQANAVTAFPKQARANRSIFMNKDGSPRTIQGVMAELDNRVRRRRINAGGGSFGPIAGNLGAPKTGGLTTTTANGPMSGLGSGTGFSPVLSQLSSGSKPAFSMVPTGTPQTPAKPPISSMPAPSIDRSAGLNMLGPDASDSSAGYAAQQRRAAAVTDYRSGEAVQETSKQLSSVVEVLGKSFQVQTEILTVLRRIENKEPSKPTAVVPVPPATSTRRPPEALPAASPVSVKRNNG